MHDPAVYSIRVDGKLGESWLDYFRARSISVQVDQAGLCSTTLITEPVDQSALIGIINHLNGLSLPLVSVECLPASRNASPSEDWHS
jgi:hypothetical protein